MLRSNLLFTKTNTRLEKKNTHKQSYWSCVYWIILAKEKIEMTHEMNQNNLSEQGILAVLEEWKEGTEMWSMNGWMDGWMDGWLRMGNGLQANDEWITKTDHLRQLHGWKNLLTKRLASWVRTSNAFATACDEGGCSDFNRNGSIIPSFKIWKLKDVIFYKVYVKCKRVKKWSCEA